MTEKKVLQANKEECGQEIVHVGMCCFWNFGARI